jgi:hypothetical protein
MPLIVGVENGIEKGFTNSDLELINGFALGTIMMITGIGEIDNVEKFRLRTLEANFTNEIYPKDRLRDKLTVEFIQRMKDAGWYCNVPRSTDRQFRAEIKRRLYSYHETDFREWMLSTGKYREK